MRWISKLEDRMNAIGEVHGGARVALNRGCEGALDGDVMECMIILKLRDPRYITLPQEWFWVGEDWQVREAQWLVHVGMVGNCKELRTVMSASESFPYELERLRLWIAGSPVKIGRAFSSGGAFRRVGRLVDELEKFVVDEGNGKASNMLYGLPAVVCVRECGKEYEDYCMER